MSKMLQDVWMNISWLRDLRTTCKWTLEAAPVAASQAKDWYSHNKWNTEHAHVTPKLTIINVRRIDDDKLGILWNSHYHLFVSKLDWLFSNRFNATVLILLVRKFCFELCCRDAAKNDFFFNGKHDWPTVFFPSMWKTTKNRLRQQQANKSLCIIHAALENKFPSDDERVERFCCLILFKCVSCATHMRVTDVRECVYVCVWVCVLLDK